MENSIEEINFQKKIFCFGIVLLPILNVAEYRSLSSSVIE